MNIFGDIDSKKNPSLFTAWFLVHLLFGVILMYIFYIYFSIDIWLSILIILIIHTIYEINDLFINPLFYQNTNLKKNHSIINSLGDTIGCIIGILIVVIFIRDKNNIFFISAFTLYFVLIFIFKKLNIN